MTDSQAQSSTTLYLPLGARTAERVLDLTGQVFTDSIQTLPLAEIVSLYIIQSLAEKPSDIGRRDAEAILNQALLPLEKRPSGLQDALAAAIDRGRLLAGLKKMPGASIGFAPKDFSSEAHFRKADGSWDQHSNHMIDAARAQLQRPTTPGRKISQLTGDQSRATQIAKQSSDGELVYIKAPAGSGKTALTPVLVEHFRAHGIPASRIAVVARSPAQQSAVRSALNRQSGRLYSFRQLLTADGWGQNYPGIKNSPGTRLWPFKQLASRLGVIGFGKYSPEKLVGIVREAIKTFCHSLDTEISENHLPSRITSDNTVTQTDRKIVVQYAQQIFNELFHPKLIKGLVRPADYHLIKKRALDHAAFHRGEIETIIIDEAHSINRPLLSLLELSFEIPVLLLGDPLQDIQGESATLSGPHLQVEMRQSVRLGAGTSHLLNPILSAHPAQGIYSAGILENQFHTANIIRYRNVPPFGELANEAFNVLTSSAWGLFEFSHRLKHHGIVFRLVDPRARSEITQFYYQLRDLIKDGRRPDHHSLAGINYRVDLDNACRERATVRKVVSMFEQGYSDTHFRELEEWIDQPSASRTKVTMDTADRLQSTEFSTVVIANDLTDDLPENGLAEYSDRERKAFLNKLWLSLTRSRGNLIVPESFLEWANNQTTRTR